LIALIGGKGNMGRRYAACLKFLNEDFRIIDVDTSFEEREDILSHSNKAVICTATRTHLELASEMQTRGITYLVEKPFAKFYPSEFIPGNGFIVNNWSFIANDHTKDISYNFYNTGKDGLLWDVCQLITCAFKYKSQLIIECSSPVWDVRVNGRMVAYREIEESYIWMLKAFINQDKLLLWPIEVGLDQIRQVNLVSLDVGVNHEQSVSFGTGSIIVDPSTWKDFSPYRRQVSFKVGS
jgi:hypothetical protein